MPLFLVAVRAYVRLGHIMRRAMRRKMRATRPWFISVAVALLIGWMMSSVLTAGATSFVGSEPPHVAADEEMGQVVTATAQTQVSTTGPRSKQQPDGSVWHVVQGGDTLFILAIDGCGQVRKFISITMPQLMPVTFYVVTMGIIGCFQIFDQAFILSGGDGGPQNSTLTFTLYIYQLAFNSSDMGRASMIAFILAIIIFSVSYGIDKVFNADKVNG